MIEEVRTNTHTRTYINTHVFNKPTTNDRLRLYLQNLGQDTGTGGQKNIILVIIEKEEEKTAVEDNFEAYVDFQSHEPEFDYLQESEIEKYQQNKFCKRSQSALISSQQNDKTIKLWKVRKSKSKQ